MGKLYLIRHGETNSNKNGIYSGRSDISLNSAGRRQARKLAGLMKNDSIDVFFSSPLARARQTAESCARGKKIILVPELSEIDFGKWEGLTFRKIQTNFNKDLSAWLANPVSNRIPGGESYADVRKRVLRSFRDISRRYTGKNIAFVTHHTPFKIILFEKLGLGKEFFWDISIDNTATCIFRI